MNDIPHKYRLGVNALDGPDITDAIDTVYIAACKWADAHGDDAEAALTLRCVMLLRKDERGRGVWWPGHPPIHVVQEEVLSAAIRYNDEVESREVTKAIATVAAHWGWR